MVHGTQGPAAPCPADVSNIAVSGAHRRRGVGTALLQRCERQARLWRQDSLWLHVELTNKAALKVGGCGRVVTGGCLLDSSVRCLPG